MKSSSIIFVGGFTLIFGFFAAESFKADSRAMQTSDIRASFLQADLIAMSGLYLATYEMSQATGSYSRTYSSINGGRLYYKITVLSSDGVGPTVVGIVDTATVGQVKIIKRAQAYRGVQSWSTWYWYQWTLQNVYTDPYNIADIVVE